ncbi:MAG TPA: hypothetical protein VK971_05175 [Thiohalobacter sp.]|nr:hypothetical protein [Thiohalobacter sp.]
MKLPTRRSVLIVADGPSAEILRHKVLPQSLYVIGINAASIWLPRCDAFFTCYPDRRVRMMMANRRVGTRYYCAAPPNYGSMFADREMSGPREKNVTFFRRLDNQHGICSEPDTIHGGNSAWGALGLAHHMAAKRVAIVGLDANDEPRVSGGRPELPDLQELFAGYDGKPQVVNGSPRSNIEAFPRMGVGEAISWLL